MDFIEIPSGGHLGKEAAAKGVGALCQQGSNCGATVPRHPLMWISIELGVMQPQYIRYSKGFTFDRLQV